MSNALLPSVAIVTVNYNGKKYLQTCFESLRQLNYAKDKMEIICVDNGSSDGSVTFIRQNFPNVRCIESGANIGFAAGCNLGAKSTQSDYVAFVNNDATVAENWLLELVKALQEDEETVCAAAKILDSNGKFIDFVEGQLNFYGFAHQVAWRSEVEPGFFGQRKAILFACGGAMLINRQVFLEVGGFDDDYFMFFEDVDLGWRLWVLGYKVIFVPEAITYHRFHGSAGEVVKYRRYFSYERNALATIIKNYDQSNLDKILPVALFLSVQRTIDYLGKSNIAPDALHPYNWAKSGNKKLRETISIGQLSPLLATGDIVANIPALMEKRKSIQANRKRSDQEIIRLFGQPLRIHTATPGAAYAQAQENLINAFQVGEIFQEVGKRILILCNFGLPTFGFPPTSASLRAEAMGKGLKARGLEVLYSLPIEVVDNHPIPKHLKKLAWDKTNLDDIVLDTGPDVTIVCDWQILEFMKWGIYRPIVLDYCNLNNQMVNSNPTNRYKDFLANVDLFTCCAEDQREPLRRWLKREGIIVDQDKIQVVPGIISSDDNNTVKDIEPLVDFCRHPTLRGEKIKHTDTSPLSLPVKAWQILKENGPKKLIESVQKYITWRREVRG